jgi:5-methylcytosine-specific restriction endonuclease McrA
MKIPKQPRRRKTDRKILIAELDKLFSRLVRLEAKGHCEVCGRPKTFEELACCHIFSRKNLNTRWDKKNAFGGCWQCHLQFAHKEPIRFYDWVRERLGDEEFKKLRQRADTSAKGLDLMAVKIYLESELLKKV